MKKILLSLLLLPLFAASQNDSYNTKKYYRYGVNYLRLTVGNSIGFQLDSTGSIIRYNNAVPTAGVILYGNGTKFTTLAAGTSAQKLSGGSTPSWKDTTAVPVVTEGTYTPTLSNTTNIAASTASVTHYQRIGDVIHVWGTVTIDATTALTLSELGLSLPVASSIGNDYELAGAASFEDNTSVQIKGDTANDRAMFRFTPQTATNNTYSFHFTYKYIAP